jgi:hypothetical protein
MSKILRSSIVRGTVSTRARATIGAFDRDRSTNDEDE